MSVFSIILIIFGTLTISGLVIFILVQIKVKKERAEKEAIEKQKYLEHKEKQYKLQKFYGHFNLSERLSRIKNEIEIKIKD